MPRRRTETSPYDEATDGRRGDVSARGGSRERAATAAGQVVAAPGDRAAAGADERPAGAAGRDLPCRGERIDRREGRGGEAADLAARRARSPADAARRGIADRESAQRRAWKAVRARADDAGGH